MKRIKLTQGKYAIVDDEDYPYLNRFKWYYSEKIQKSGHVTSIAVAYINNNNKGAIIEMTRLIIPLQIQKHSQKKLLEVFHLNHNSLDNRKTNLKLVTLAQARHLYSKRKGTRSKYRGIWLCRETGIWIAEISKDKKKYRLGRFKEQHLAAKAYNKKAKEIYGKLAYQNKI